MPWLTGCKARILISSGSTVRCLKMNCILYISAYLKVYLLYQDMVQWYLWNSSLCSRNSLLDSMLLETERKNWDEILNKHQVCNLIRRWCVVWHPAHACTFIFAAADVFAMGSDQVISQTQLNRDCRRSSRGNETFQQRISRLNYAPDTINWSTLDSFVQSEINSIFSNRIP